jgi:putative ABC transport system permease protein
MRALNRKLLRDLWGMRGQALAIALVMACGVAMFIMWRSTHGSLERAMATYYERYRFADAFAHLKRAPSSVRERIAEVPGIAQVQTRVAAAVTLDIPGFPEPAAARLVSIPDYQAPQLNDLYLRSGRYIEPGRKGEVLADEGFVLAHELKPGSQVRAVINGHKETLTIVGVVLSPEHIYQIRPGEMLPDPKRFGIFWMGYTHLAAAFDMQGAFNDVAVTLAPGASEPEVLLRLDRILAPYGGLGAYGRDDQASHKFVSNELRELEAMAFYAPIIFLAVAAFLLNVVISRLIGTQREQIAALKAFGYTKLQIAVHYLGFVVGIVAVAAVLGTALGLWFGQGMTTMYARFFHFPVFDFRWDPATVVIAFLVATAAGVLGTLAAVRRAAQLPPAQAMRPEPPADFRPTILERLGLQKLLSPLARMILRQLERRPIKSLLSAFGIALAAAVLVLGNFSADAVVYVLDTQFHVAQRQDVTLTFVEPRSVSVLAEVRHLPGVHYTEPFRAVPVRFRSQHRSRRIGILGLPPDRHLFHLMDMYGKAVELPPEGLVVSAKLAEVLEVRPGDTVVVEVMEGKRPVRTAVIAGLIDDFVGTSAYMDLRAVNRLMREGPTVSGAYLAVDGPFREELYHKVKNTPGVAAAAIKDAAIQSFRDTIGEHLLRMRFFNVIFAGVIACGVVYNSARISLAERSRELATLRVIGFTRGEISLILLGELAVLTLVAIPFGLLMGYGFAALATTGFSSELFRLPLIVDRWTYAFAATTVLVAALVSGLIVRRMLDRLDLVSVLKSKE